VVSNWQREFFKLAAAWLQIRLWILDGATWGGGKVGAQIGELDHYAEMTLLLEEL
jgi:hypothetical protein